MSDDVVSAMAAGVTLAPAMAAGVMSRAEAAVAVGCSVSLIDEYSNRGILERVYSPGSMRARGVSSASVMRLVNR